MHIVVQQISREKSCFVSPPPSQKHCHFTNIELEFLGKGNKKKKTALLFWTDVCINMWSFMPHVVHIYPFSKFDKYKQNVLYFKIPKGYQII